MFKAPTQTPHIATLLDDMPTTSDKLIARHLGLAKSTIARYRRTGNAPRLVHLALFWESRWGLSVLDCEILNRDALRLQHIAALERENTRLHAQLQRLVALGGFGAANDPLWSVSCERSVAGGAMAVQPLAAMPAAGVKLVQQLHAHPAGYAVAPSGLATAQVSA